MMRSHHRARRMDEAVQMIAAASRHGQRTGGPRVLMLLIHSLTDEEQTAQFGEMPWFVRKVLVRWMWAPSFRACLKCAHNPSIAL